MLSPGVLKLVNPGSLIKAQQQGIIVHWFIVGGPDWFELSRGS